MRPKWFTDSIPLDPFIAPMVLFFQDNGIQTFNSCEGGGEGHLYGKPTISFRATTIKDIDRVARLLQDNNLDTSLEVGLMTGFFSTKLKSNGIGARYGLAHWIWTNEDRGIGTENLYKDEVYNRVIELVNMNEIRDITMDHKKWVEAGRPKLGTKLKGKSTK